MILSYTLRLACLALASQAVLQLTAELVLWAAAPLLLRMMAPLTMRRRERLLYAIQIVPFLTALLLTTLLCLPQYAHGETNLAAENVGRLSLLFTAAIAASFGAAALRGLLLVLRTQRFIRACKRDGTLVATLEGGTPVLSLEAAAGIALVGLFDPIVLVAPPLAMTAEALSVALDHECAHARQLDNWKLLTLRALPLLPLRSASGRTWMHHWQAAAELAADDDAAGSSPDRALLLAESLLTVARHAIAHNPRLLQTSLTCAEPGLTQRIERLLHPGPASSHSAPLAAIVAVACAIVAIAFWITNQLLTASVLHTLAERLLHLG